jgi:hypothetical protein
MKCGIAALFLFLTKIIRISYFDIRHSFFDIRFLISYFPLPVGT